MKRIINFINNNIELILIIFLISQPFIDLMTSLMIKLFNIEITIGIIIRSLSLLLIGLFYVFYVKDKYKKLSILYLSAILFYIIIYVVNIALIKSSSVIFIELKYLIKAFYFPIMLLLFYKVFNNNIINIKTKHFAITACVYVLIITIATITGTNFESYGGAKTGTVGWFYAANEIGSIIAISFPIVLQWSIKSERKLFAYLIMCLYVFVALTIGTKVPFLGIIITFIVFGIFYMIRYILTRDKQNIVILIFPIVIIGLLILFSIPYTPVGKNLNMHFKMVNVDGFSDFFKSENKENLDTSEKSDPLNIIYSSRDKYLVETKQNYKKSDIKQKLIGIGYIENYGSKNEKTKAIEMDFYETFYRFGIIGFILYFIFPVILLYKFLNNIFRNIKDVIINEKIVSLCVSLLLSLSIAFIAGHVLTAPAVAIFIVYVINILNQELNKKV